LPGSSFSSISPIQALLDGSDLDVTGGHIGEQEHEHVIIVLDQGIQFGLGGLGIAGPP
jgi:hypothetical protein